LRRCREGAGHDYPTGPAVNAGAHVLRGGSWYNVPAGLRAAIRLELDPRDRCLIFGFPVARALG